MVIRGCSWPFVANPFITDTIFWHKTEVSLLKIIFKSELLCSLNWTTSGATGHDTGIGTGLSLAQGTSDCFDFTVALLFDGMTDFVK